MEQDKGKKEVNKPAFQAYDNALRAYKVALRIPPESWKTFTDELSKFVTGKSPHELVFENADREYVRCMPDGLVKAAIAFAQAQGAKATKIVLPKKLRKIPEWLPNFTELETLEIGSDFVDSYISLQHFPKLKQLRVHKNPIALSEVEVPANCKVICEGYEQCKSSPLEKFGRLLKVYGCSEGNATWREVYRATEETTEASFNVVDRGLDPEDPLNIAGICSAITQLWLEERYNYRQAKASYLNWREWGWGWSKIQEKYASRDGKKFQFVYQQLVELVHQKSSSLEELYEWKEIVDSRRAEFGDAPTYVFRLSKIGEFLALVFEKMEVEGKKFHHMSLRCINHEMGLEFNIKRGAQNQKVFKVVFFDPNKGTRHSASRANSLATVRAWTAAQLTGRFLPALELNAYQPVSKHFIVENDPVYLAINLEVSFKHLLLNSVGEPNIHVAQMEKACTLEFLFFWLWGSAGGRQLDVWKHHALRSIDALKGESLEAKIDLIEGRVARRPAALLDKVIESRLSSLPGRHTGLTTLRYRPTILPKYIEVMHVLGLSGLEIANSVADSLLFHSARPHSPMHEIMSSADRIKTVVKAVVLLKLSKEDIVKLFCPEYVSSPTHTGSAHLQPLSAMCTSLVANSIGIFFKGLEALSDSNLLDDAGMDAILEFHLPSRQMWNVVCEQPNTLCRVIWLPRLLNELRWSQKSRVKVLNLIGFPCKSLKEGHDNLIGDFEFIDQWADWLIGLTGPLSLKRAERLHLLVKLFAGVGDGMSLDIAYKRLVIKNDPIVASALVKIATKLTTRTSTSTDTFVVSDAIKEILEEFKSCPKMKKIALVIFFDLSDLTALKKIDQKTMAELWNSSGLAILQDKESAQNKLFELHIPLKLDSNSKLVAL